VLNRWNSDRSCFGLSFAQQLVNARKGAGAKLSGYCGGARMVMINDADEFNFTFLREVAVDTCVVAPEGSNADCGGFEWSWQCLFPILSLNQSEEMTMFA
jgi:hypothetical protein